MLLHVGPLPDDALGASATFHADVLPEVLRLLDGGEEFLTLVFAPASHAHRSWRAAAVQTLAVARAPQRINAVAGDNEAAIAAAQAYIAAAPGVTGHYLSLDDTGAGDVL